MSYRIPGLELMGVVDAIYATALEPQRFDETLRRLNECLGGVMVHVDRRDLASGRLLASQASSPAPVLARAHEQEYLGRWGEHDPLAALLCSRQSAGVARCHDHFDDDFVASNDFYQQFLLRNGLRWKLGGMYVNDDGTGTVVSAVRPADDAPYDAERAEVLNQLLPHLKRANLLRARVEEAGPLDGTNLFEALPLPLMLTDVAGRCLEVNEAFPEVERSLGSRIVLGRLRLPLADAQAAWERALAETASTAVPRAVALAGSGRQWRAHLIPLAKMMPGGGERRMILALFEENKSPVPSVSNFAIHGRFTRAELEVLAGLMQGLSAKAIANQRGASVNTVRSQIMSILEKSGHTSQRGLIAAFGASAFQDSRSNDSSFLDD